MCRAQFIAQLEEQRDNELARREAARQAHAAEEEAREEERRVAEANAVVDAEGQAAVPEEQCGSKEPVGSSAKKRRRPQVDYAALDEKMRREQQAPPQEK